MNSMQVVYAKEQLPKSWAKAIFLAGPTPRDENTVSWRTLALDVLYNMGYDGVVFVPEPRGGKFTEGEYEDQLEWEELCLNCADRILFWIPRKVSDPSFMGLTTNDEYGVWKRTGKAVLGFPKDAEKVRYQEYYAKKYGVPVFNNLYLALSRCVTDLGEGTTRIGGERLVPLHIFEHPAFKEWYLDMKKAGNRLDDAKVLWSHSVKAGSVFCFTLWAKVWIASESRHKSNEFMFGRPSISSCLMYFRSPVADLLDTEIVVVDEFRTPVSNGAGMVRELPGGSSFKPSQDPLSTVAEEVSEETGVTVDPTRLELIGVRQLQATTLTHKAHLFAYELNELEMMEIKKRVGEVNGNVEDTEMCYLGVKTVRELLQDPMADWSTIGMVLSKLV